MAGRSGAARCEFEGRTALLSPFDRLAYDRARAEQLFDFEYSLEMYKPAAKRRWGYFALPILHGDRLVGKLDAAADPKAGVLRVNAIHEDVKFTRVVAKAVGPRSRRWPRGSGSTARPSDHNGSTASPRRTRPDSATAAWTPNGSGSVVSTSRR